MTRPLLTHTLETLVVQADRDASRNSGNHLCADAGPTAPARTIALPFPPASLSGHAKGHWRAKSGPTAKHREWARLATLSAAPSVPAQGDILVTVRFVPADRRGDRTNFANRMKPYFDGIADALGVNDARFLPRYEFAPPEKPGRVEVRIEAPQA